MASHDRILTTHVGSLPRSPALSDLLIHEELGEAIDPAALERETARAVDEVVRRQVEAGIDVINDGEQPRVGFQTYVPQRMQGFGGASQRLTPTDYAKFPEFAQRMAARFPRRTRVHPARCTVVSWRSCSTSCSARRTRASASARTQGR